VPPKRTPFGGDRDEPAQPKGQAVGDP
jgi:hypothetical protein